MSHIPSYVEGATRAHTDHAQTRRSQTQTDSFEQILDSADLQDREPKKRKSETQPAAAQPSERPAERSSRAPSEDQAPDWIQEMEQRDSRAARELSQPPTLSEESAAMPQEAAPAPEQVEEEPLPAQPLSSEADSPSTAAPLSAAAPLTKALTPALAAPAVKGQVAQTAGRAQVSTPGSAAPKSLRQTPAPQAQAKPAPQTPQTAQPQNEIPVRSFKLVVDAELTVELDARGRRDLGVHLDATAEAMEDLGDGMEEELKEELAEGGYRLEAFTSEIRSEESEEGSPSDEGLAPERQRGRIINTVV